MLKLTSLAIGLLTAISLAPAAQAMNASGNTSAIHQASDNLHAQIIIKVNPQIGGHEYGGERNHRWEEARRREAEYAREREAREAHARWESEQRRHREYAHRHNRHERHEYDRYDHRGGYRRDR
jgi:hypothetical protein